MHTQHLHPDTETVHAHEGGDSPHRHADDGTRVVGVDGSNEALAPDAHPADRLGTADVYPTAHRAAQAVLEVTAAAEVDLNRFSAERIVSTVLGAALAHLEQPWRKRYAQVVAHGDHLSNVLAHERSRADRTEGALEVERRRVETFRERYAEVRTAFEAVGAAITSAPERTRVALHDTAAERARQVVDLGHTPQSDQERGPGHVLAEALERIEQAGPRPDREELVEAAALIVAAIEVLDARDGQ